MISKILTCLFITIFSFTSTGCSLIENFSFSEEETLLETLIEDAFYNIPTDISTDGLTEDTIIDTSDDNSIPPETIASLNEEYILFDDMNLSKLNILNYVSLYEDISSHYFKNQLSTEEKILYNSFIYAYENNYKKINFFSTKADIQDNLNKALQALSSDNPFFDWNYSYTMRYDYSTNLFEINLNSLENNDFDLKVEAYNKAKNIVSTIPDNYSDYEKVKFIYDYIINNVRYVDNLEYYTSNTPHYIYDALFKGSTQCSGFADTVTMMCNLAGIETLTIVGTTLEDHAWNLIKLDGNYYHADATNDSNLKESLDNDYDISIAFLKSDNYFYTNGYTIDNTVNIDFPTANNTKYDTYNIDIFTDTITYDNDIATIGTTLIENGNYIVINSNQVSEINISEDFLSPLLTYLSNNITTNISTRINVSYLVFSQNNTLIVFLNLEPL